MAGADVSMGAKGLTPKAEGKGETAHEKRGVEGHESKQECAGHCTLHLIDVVGSDQRRCNKKMDNANS